MAELAKEFGIGYVRLGKKGIIRGTRGRLTAGILASCTKADRKFLLANERESSDWVTSFDWFASQEEFLKTVQLSEYSHVEVVFHPERPDEKRVLESW
jgi:hypothetical protein